MRESSLQLETREFLLGPKNWIAALFWLSLAPLAATAQDITSQTPGLLPGMNEEMLVDPATFNISGGWAYSSEPGVGLMDIYQDGDGIVLEIVSGSTCNPAAMCTLSGAIEDKALIVSVTAAIPGDGGQATSTFVIYFESENEARGMGTSIWQGGGGEMQWDYMIEMWRPGTRD